MREKTIYTLIIRQLENIKDEKILYFANLSWEEVVDGKTIYRGESQCEDTLEKAIKAGHKLLESYAR